MHYEELARLVSVTHSGEKSWSFVFEREKSRSAKVFKSSGRQFFLERAVKALPLFIYLTIKKKTSVGSVLSKNSI